ncbi:MAG: hypothetical protein M5U18_12315 [Dehalococcoidia bacterium]|nr:hypothetical protein [Dehalococcoidia bacterium]
MPSDLSSDGGVGLDGLDAALAAFWQLAREHRLDEPAVSIDVLEMLGEEYLQSDARVIFPVGRSTGVE